MKAVIFDMDGVISDTYHIHARAEMALLSRYGIAISEKELHRRFAGVSVEHVFRTLFSEHGVSVDIDELVAEKRAAVLAAVHEIVEVPGAKELIAAMHGEGLKIAVASGSTHQYISIVLDALQLSSAFDAIVSNYDVPQGKPAPDIFLLAAQKLGVDPAECVVIEDGISGMVGARAAGMKCIALVKDDDAYPAVLVVKSLAELSAERITAL